MRTFGSILYGAGSFILWSSPRDRYIVAAFGVMLQLIGVMCIADSMVGSK
jgi:hypothetical protein